ncbi:MAG: AraC family transcriptional regulator [Desulfobacteraceae bacterium]|nr:MAG: AraC family transcriptional regulator [Desulfobacteraceae bacterium]
MKAFNTILLLIMLFGAFLSLFAALIILRLKHGNLKANRFFGIFLLCTTVFLVRGFLLFGGLYTFNPLLVELGDNAKYFFSPAFYFYIRSASDRDFRFRPYDFLHLLPLGLNLTVKMKFYLSGRDDQIRFLANWLDGSILQPGYLWDSVSRAVFFACFCFYVFLSMRLYRKNREKILQAFPLGAIHWSWIRILTRSLLPCLLVWLACIPFLLAGHSLRFFFGALHLSVALVVLFGLFRVFSRPEILHFARPLKSEKKYDRSNLNPGDYQMYFDRLTIFMEHKEGYTDPDLTLTGLAEILSIPRNDLSRIINEKTGKTFNDYINYYRVQKVIALFKDPRQKNETLLTLAFQAGFNSKTPFNSAFKKMTGESPVVFRKKLLEETRSLPAESRPPRTIRIVRLPRR